MISEIIRLVKGPTFLAAILVPFLLAEAADESFRIGVIADCQYCSDPGKGKRKYSLSEKKLQACIDHFNTMELEYVIHLGDFIDRDFESFDVVSPIYNQLKAPHYHVLGNHDFSVADPLKDKVPETMGLSSRYYDFKVEEWRFIVIDGNDISFHAYAEGSDPYRAAEKYYQDHQLDLPKWNGALGADQMRWLKLTLDKAQEANEKVILYCHFPVFPADRHNLWNAEEVVTLISGYRCVKAYINGHNHAGNYAGFGGVHYLTLQGMVDTTETAYAVLELTDDHLKVTGYGREGDRELRVR